jgi:hypothetical protein
MVETPTDAMPQILIKIQDSISMLRSDLTGRLERIETLVRKQRREGAAMLVMMRATVSDFDERVSDVEERLAALEAGQGSSSLAQTCYIFGLRIRGPLH